MPKNWFIVLLVIRDLKNKSRSASFGRIVKHEWLSHLRYSQINNILVNMRKNDLLTSRTIKKLKKWKNYNISKTGFRYLQVYDETLPIDRNKLFHPRFKFFLFS